jgi:hypothetical protein
MTTRRKSPKRHENLVPGVGRGMCRAVRTAREMARRYGTPIYLKDLDECPCFSPLEVSGKSGEVQSQSVKISAAVGTSTL